MSEYKDVNIIVHAMDAWFNRWHMSLTTVALEIDPKRMFHIKLVWRYSTVSSYIHTHAWKKFWHILINVGGHMTL